MRNYYQKPYFLLRSYPHLFHLPTKSSKLISKIFSLALWYHNNNQPNKNTLYFLPEPQNTYKNPISLKSKKRYIPYFRYSKNETTENKPNEKVKYTFYVVLSHIAQKKDIEAQEYLTSSTDHAVQAKHAQRDFVFIHHVRHRPARSYPWARPNCSQCPGSQSCAESLHRFMRPCSVQPVQNYTLTILHGNGKVHIILSHLL
jgi:hypothetical protein